MQAGFELLQITWFFSSLYLLALYLNLFVASLRGVAAYRLRYTGVPSRLVLIARVRVAAYAS